MQTKALEAAAQRLRHRDQQKLVQKCEKQITKPTIYTRAFVVAEVTALFYELIANDTIIYKGQLIASSLFTPALQ